MVAFFETSCKIKTSAKQHLNFIKYIYIYIYLNVNGHEFISKFKKVKDLLGTYSARTRQKYSTSIQMFIDHLNLKTDVLNMDKNTTVLVLEHKHLILDLDLQTHLTQQCIKMK